ncbi:TetR/AcrR family transcriptional regulator [Amycolatopsis anabasis]|uniref:TetR/AcrR family transcriptional regulator n=1 Tax=Amycolatopsis anabasis TaxID=1840409 RepID=UPI00131D331A|nr:TetR/AcrR family transcriptional regulator [Amycolatopsis anabasis]
MSAGSWTAKGRATRERIVESAAELMFRRGVAGTSLDDIRAATGVSKSQLYHYFADKTELVHAVVTRQARAVLAAQQALFPALDSWDALHAWRDALVKLQRQRHCEGGCPIGSLTSELADVDEPARIALADGFDRWETWIREGLAAMRDRGELRPDADPDTLALATLASLQGGLLLTQARRTTKPLEAALDAAFAHLRAHRPA